MISDKIIVVDDDPKVIKAVKMILRDYEIIGFQEGQEVVKYLSKPRDVKLVLMDVYMKDINGLHILAKIKKMNRHLAVIIMTAFGSQEIVLEALRGRADDFIEKPFQVAELRDKVREILKLYGSYDDRNRDTRISRIRRMIERNVPDISLEHIAGELHLNPKYISRFFQERNPQGFREYKMDLKIEKAKSLLIHSDLTIEQISDKLGYSNPESFMRTFKKMTALTATEYRKEVLAGRIPSPQKGGLDLLAP